MKQPTTWLPSFLLRPPVDLSAKFPPSSWAGIEWVLPALLHEFVPQCNYAVEFGVEHGYSTAALSAFFRQVAGADPLTQPEGLGDATQERLREYKNVCLFRVGWEEWAKSYDSVVVKHAFVKPDLIHIDIDPHDYPMTYAAGSWAAGHSNCVLFHDTVNPTHQISPDGRNTTAGEELTRAISDIATQQGMEFWNYPEYFGLGILVRRKA